MGRNGVVSGQRQEREKRSVWDSHAKDSEYEDFALREKTQNENCCLLGHFYPEDGGNKIEGSVISLK
jgi:hypothetical protein